MKDFKNKWEEIKNTPEKRFRSIGFNDMIMMSTSWDCEFQGTIVRTEDPKTGKITEKVYKRDSEARRDSQANEARGMMITSYNRESMYTSHGIEASEFDEALDED